MHVLLVPIHPTPGIPIDGTEQIGELVRLLRGGEGGLSMFESYPVVTGLEGMAFVGTVSRKDLVRDEEETYLCQLLFVGLLFFFCSGVLLSKIENGVL